MRLHSAQLKNINTGVLAGGIVAGAIASRLLPPLIATVSGTVRARFGEDPFKLLEQDHRSILSLLESFRTIADDSVARRVAAFLAFKRKLAKHAMAEEDIIYPLLHGHAGAEDEAKRLYSEHAQMKIHLYELETSLTTGHTWRARVSSLEELIREHIRDEEEKEFPRLRELLDERKTKTISGLIRREEALVL
jgi:hemerythrin superfamily protein